jgi:hypothetical protein
MAAVEAEIDVFAYLDYRAFLRDYYRARKAAGRGFSYRSFSRRAELKSPNYLKLVMDGDRNLSADMAKRFATACGLRGDAQRYFIDLVAFGQAQAVAERSAQHARLMAYERFSNLEQTCDAPERGMTSLTVCLGEAGLRSLRERVQRLQSELLELSARESQPEQVVQISVQFLPLSRARR